MVRRASPNGPSSAARKVGGGSGGRVQGRSKGVVAGTGSAGKSYQGANFKKQGLSQGKVRGK